MKILLDECLPRKLKRMFTGHDAVTVREMGWTGTKNGTLLRLAANEFDVFITVDQNLSHQQNIQSIDLGIIILVAPNTRIGTLQELIPQGIVLLEEIKPGEVVRIHALK